MKDTTFEVCPHCGREVELDAELKVQRCPNCGRYIVTCSMCTAIDGDEDYCSHCCLEHLADEMNKDVIENAIEKIDSLLDAHSNGIPFPADTLIVPTPNGEGYLLGISRSENGEYLITFEVDGFIFNTEVTAKYFDDIACSAKVYLDKHENEIVWDEEKYFDVCAYLDADIYESIKAHSAEEAKEKFIKKFREMSNEEFLSHIGYYRDVRELKVWDDKEQECIHDETSDLK